MVAKNDIQAFYGKFVRIVTSSHFFYRGRLITLGEDSLTLDDVKCGSVLISFPEIVSIEEWKLQ